MTEVLKGLALIAIGIATIWILDGEATVALFLIPAGALYIKEVTHGKTE